MVYTSDSTVAVWLGGGGAGAEQPAAHRTASVQATVVIRGDTRFVLLIATSLWPRGRVSSARVDGSASYLALTHIRHGCVSTAVRGAGP